MILGGGGQNKQPAQEQLLVCISHYHRYSTEWNPLFKYLFYPYFTYFKELASAILNVLNFFSKDGAPIHLLKRLKGVHVVIAYNFQNQNTCKLSCKSSP